MAALGNTLIRVRLLFEYPPPALVHTRRCWLLVDLSRCRVVSDLESVIRDRFELSRRSVLSLYIEDCYLPHTESVQVVRDNDSVRVVVDCPPQLNGHSSSPAKESETCRKRQRHTEEDGPGENPKKKTRKKKRKRSEENQERGGDEHKSKAKPAEKKKRKQQEENVPAVSPKAAAPTKKTPVRVDQPGKSTKKTQGKPQKVSSSDSSSSSSEEEEAPQKAAPQKPQTPSTPAASKAPPAAKTQKTKAPPPSSSETSSDEAPQKAAPQKPQTPSKLTASKVPSAAKNIQKKRNTPSSSSSETSSDEAPQKAAPQKPQTPSKITSAKAPPAAKTQKKTKAPSSSSSETSSDEAEGLRNLPKKTLLPSRDPKGSLNTKHLQATSSLQPKNSAQTPAASATLPPGGKAAESSSSDSEEEIQLVIRRPLRDAQHPPGSSGSQPAWRGRGGGRNSRGSPRNSRGSPQNRGRGRGGNRGQNNSFELNYNKVMEPSYQTDSLTNTSVVLQNGEENAPRRDYSSMPLLAAPPQVGQKIAFKLLELTENYTPEVSEYKEGTIMSFDQTTKQIELELLNNFQVPVEPGKFDLVYQNPDGSERVEYAVSRGSRVTERWDSLLEPRLIILT